MNTRKVVTTLIIKNAKLYDMNNVFGENRNIIIKDGKIVDIKKCNEKIDEAGDIIFDAENKIVTPGLIETNCSLGLQEAIYPDGNDKDEKDTPINPKLRAIDAINPYDESFETALKSGVTTVITGPGNMNLIGGTFAAIKTKNKNLDEIVIKDEIAFKFSMGMSPKTTYGKIGKSPVTRLGSAALIREALRKAKNYKEVNKKDFDLSMESLSRVFDGMLVKIEAKQAQDIVTAVRIAEEFNLNYTIDMATEAYLITDFIKKHKVKLVFGPVYGGKRSHELLNQEAVAGKILEDNDISFASSCSHPQVEISLILANAILMYRKGMKRENVLKSLTINAAKAVGLDSRIGSIEKGKDADLVVWDKDPLDYYAGAEAVFIEGQQVI